jgi:hypothetical protein
MMSCEWKRALSMTSTTPGRAQSNGLLAGDRIVLALPDSWIFITSLDFRSSSEL